MTNILRLHSLSTGILLGSLLLAPAAAMPQSFQATMPKSSTLVITLDHGGAPQSPNYVPAKGEYSFAKGPANFYAFLPVRVGEPAPLEAVTLRFSAPATLTKIESASSDFVVEDGGSCRSGNSYEKGDSCMVLMRFTPQGPGRRLGRLNVSHTTSAEPAAFGLGGSGYAPAISFVPALATPMSVTYSGSTGVIDDAQDLTVDGSDSLYIADSGNKVIRYIDSSGTLRSIATGLGDPPVGIAVDTFGEVYFTEPTANAMFEIYDYVTDAVQINGTGTGTCKESTSPLCDLDAEALAQPGQMGIDRNNNLVFANNSAGAALSTVQPLPATFVNLYDPFSYQEDYSDAVTVNANDDIFTFWNNNNCIILSQSLYDAEEYLVEFNKIAGGRTCGYSGDGGQAGNAEIGAVVGQIAFDIAGNLYFTDTNNQRVRRINAQTGIITTVAGTGTKGFTDFGARSTAIGLSDPTGVAVDSQGQIYIITEAPSGASTQAVEKVSATGYLVFPETTEGTTSAAQIVTVSNVGNYPAVLTSYAFTGADPTDYSIDPTTTSCLLTPGSALAAGATCQIGVLFKPATTGTLTANLVFLDNTVTNSNIVELTGVGEASAPSFVPGTISFPATAPSQTNTIPVTVTNTGNVALQVSNITLSGTNADAFTFTGNCTGGSIAPNATCALNVTFKPSSTGSYSAALNFSDNAPSSPQSVFIFGSGAKPFTSATKLVSATNPAPACSSVQFHVTVSTSDGSTAIGPVSLQVGSLTLASGTLTSGAATLTVQGLAPGLNLLTANYGGDSEHAGSASAILSQMVDRGSCGTLHLPQPVHDAQLPDHR